MNLCRQLNGSRTEKTLVRTPGSISRTQTTPSSPSPTLQTKPTAPASGDTKPPRAQVVCWLVLRQRRYAAVTSGKVTYGTVRDSAGVLPALEPMVFCIVCCISLLKTSIKAQRKVLQEVFCFKMACREAGFGVGGGGNTIS